MRFTDRRALLLAGAIVVIGVVGFLAGGSIDIVLYRLLTDGLLVLLWLAAAWGWGGLLFRSQPWSEPAGVQSRDFDAADRAENSMARPAALGRVTTIALGLGMMSLALLALGVMGWLNRPICFALMLIGLALAAIKLRRSTSARVSAWLRQPAGGSWLWIAAMPSLGIALVAATVPPGVLWGDEPNRYDVLEYHLQIPREWYESGHITPLEHNAFGYFPQGVEVHYLLAMELCGGPWAGMYAAQLMHLALVALAILAIAAGAGEIGGRLISAGVVGAGAVGGAMGSATLAGVAAAVCPWTGLLAPIAYDEGGLLLYGALAIAWAARALRGIDAQDPMRRAHHAPVSTFSVWRERLTRALSCNDSATHPDRLPDLALAAACTGLACGVKLTAVPILVVAIPIALPLAGARSRGIGRLFAGVTLFIIIALLTFGPWMARNFAWTGNPFFPEAQELFGRGPFTEIQSQRWKRAHTATPAQQTLGARLAAANAQIISDWRYGYILLPAGILAMLLTFGRRQSRFLAVLLVLLCIFWIGFTHLQGRFFILAIPICALAIGQLHGRWQLSAAAVMVLIESAIGISLMLGKFAPMADQFRAAGAFGIESLSFMIPADAQDLLQSEVPIDLVGDARAFAWQVPMSRLRYRTVFDVNARPGEPIAQAWLGYAPASGDAVVIDPPEIERLSRTYLGIPGLSSDDPAYGRLPLVIRPK